MTHFAFAFLFIAVFAFPGYARPEPEEGVAITVYNDDLAVVKDRRLMTIPKGIGKVEFTDVATRIDATSVRFESLTDPDTSVLEQNYEYDLVGPSKLLQKYIDEQVRVFTKDGDLREGKLLSQAEGKIVLQGEDGKLQLISGGDNILRVELVGLPDGLITRPTLVWETDSKKGGEQLCQVSYMTGGISWSADYLVVIDEEDTELDLTGWVTLVNNSGATYEQADLKLIAGDVQRVRPQPVMKQRMLMEDAVGLAPAAPPFEEKSFFEYHLYTLQRPTTIKQAQTKQVQLLSASGVRGEKTYLYNGSRNGEKVEVKMKFENTEDNNMGMPLPAGKIRAFKADSDGSLEFIGEDRIDHTPRNEEIELKLGNAFDIVGERKMTDRTVVVQNRIFEETYEIELRNRKEEAVTIRVEEPVWGDWKVLRADAEPRKEDAGTLVFEVEVPADTVKTLTYTIRFKR